MHIYLKMHKITNKVLVHIYLKMHKITNKGIFVTNSGFQISIFCNPMFIVDLSYFKLCILLNLNNRSLKNKRFIPIGCKDIGIINLSLLDYTRWKAIHTDIALILYLKSVNGRFSKIFIKLACLAKAFCKIISV